MRRGPRSALIAAAILPSLLGFGCRALSSNRISLTRPDSGRSLAIAVGDQIEVTLQTIGPGEYGNPVVSSGAIQFLGQSLLEPHNPGGPRQLFRFQAEARGRADIVIPHTGESPVGPATAPFSLIIEVY